MKPIFSLSSKAGVFSFTFMCRIPPPFIRASAISTGGNVKTRLRKSAISKSKELTLLFLNFRAILAYQDGSFSKAAYFWKECLKKDSNYKPAILNLGLLSLKFADFKRADEMFNLLEETWFVLYAKAILYRHLGELKKSNIIYTELIKIKKDFDPLTYNYGIYLLQVNNDVSNARKIINSLSYNKEVSYQDESLIKVINNTK